MARTVPAKFIYSAQIEMTRMMLQESKAQLESFLTSTLLVFQKQLIIKSN